jgi:putative acetyltransferase
MKVKVDDLTGSKSQLFLKEDLADMARNSPPESIHALPVEELRKPEIPFGA